MKWVLVVLLCSMLAGCTKTLYVPVESVRTEYVNKLQRDSIYFYEKDSVYIKGDTVHNDKLIYKYRDKIICDTVQNNDTIRVPYPVEKIVIVNELHWWQESLMWAGVVAIIILLVILWSQIKK